MNKETKPVVIEIQGRQSFQGSKPESMQLVTDGLYWGSDGKYMISYPESEMTGLAGTTTTFEVSGNSASLIREGAVTSHMIFEPGRKHLSLYDMGFGALTIGVNASKVKSNLSETGGTLEIDYKIEIEHMIAGENSFLITVRESSDKTLVQ